MYTRHDNLVPATSEEEVLLAIKKAKSNAIINLCFAIGVGTLAITRVQIASPLQTATCLAVMLVFSLRFVVDIFIVVRGNDQISRQYYPTIEVEDEPGENTNA